MLKITSAEFMQFYSTEIPLKLKFRIFARLKMAVFGIPNSSKLISRKIIVTEFVKFPICAK